MNENKQESDEINFRKIIKKLKIPDNLGTSSVREESAVEFIIIVE